jgi:hypothetical protein
MATNSLVPYSNPAGNNQTSTTSKAGTGSAALTLPGANTSTIGASSSNPLVPAASSVSSSITPSSGTVASSSNAALQSQLDDIYGTGVGNELDSLLGSISGTDSETLKEYTASLQPQMATAQANTNAALGAGGVSANSSVAAIADSNLQAQETASIAGESASLTQSQQSLEAQLLGGISSAAAQETADQAAMPWEVAGGMMNMVGGFFGNSNAGSGMIAAGKTESTV